MKWKVEYNYWAVTSRTLSVLNCFYYNDMENQIACLTSLFINVANRKQGLVQVWDVPLSYFISTLVLYSIGQFLMFHIILIAHYSLTIPHLFKCSMNVIIIDKSL